MRVEVISFRGNTSSDLIDVADQFTDIAQVARVEKGSARSGRRVAAEGDLSMTEVPEKETEGAPRRRRGRAAEGRAAEGRAAEGRAAEGRAAGGRAVEERAVAAAERDAQPANLIVLPGERLSRRTGDEDGVADGEAETEEALEGADEPEAVGEDGPRRRRRRGGRGRGRGRRTDEAGVPMEESAAGGGDGEEDEEFDEPQPAQLPHHAFGSVWDSQIGVPSSAMPPADSISGGEAGEDEDYAEPEVPEYLLAERRQRGQRPSGGGARAPRGR